jgi:thioredoxin 2
MDTPKLMIGCPHCGATNRLPAERAGESPFAASAASRLLDGHPLELGDATSTPWWPHCGCRCWWTSGRPGAGPAARWRRLRAGVAQLQGRALLVKVNSDDNPGLSQRFGIRSIPTLVKLQQGRETQRQSGAMPAGAIVAAGAGWA